MTRLNALGFFLLGLGMLWLPALAPSLITPSPIFGTSTRGLWLLFMGALNVSIGGGVLGWQAMLDAWRLPTWLEPIRPLPKPLSLPAPVRAAA